MIRTNIENFVLKEATRKDANIVYDFIRQLAEYEQMANDLTGSVEQLEKNIWDKHYAEVLLAYYNNIPVGFCLFFTTFSTFTCQGVMYLEDVFVTKEYRNRGFGQEIFYQLAIIAQERDYSRFEWVCLDWNEPSIRFYEDVIKAKAQKEWIRFRLDDKGIANLNKRK